MISIYEAERDVDVDRLFRKSIMSCNWCICRIYCI